jgi:hypothetical protein
MSRHPLDRHEGASPSRAERFAEIDRKTAPEGSHKAAQAAHRQPKDRAKGARLKEFARVERGEEA